ncbi:MAG TPA: helix-hairpin-helix domain-containing protein [Fimbriiglobus sp.]|nr:helix-hairpin-helix domain-containing protein [Fimbriiglobus sp.]
MSAPLPAPVPSSPPSRPARVALAVIGVVMVGLLAYRGYGHRLTARPTEHHPAAISRHVDLNTADRAELLQIPSVGPTLADAILTHRRDHGQFAAVDDLTAVHGIGDRTLAKIRPWVEVPAPAEPTVERLERKPPAAPARAGKLRPGDPPLDVNAASEADLQRLPGVGPATARKIIAARAERPFESPDDLLRVKGIGPKTVEKLRPLVVCR